MTEPKSGVEAAPVTDWRCRDNPVTAECFLPPRFSCPRAWERVAVAPVPGLRRQSKIWKRVGGLATGSGQSPYIRAMAELEKQGMGPRKRARHAHHMQAWGDAKWDPRAEGHPDGHQDIAEAQGMVSDAAHEATTTTTILKTKPATYPEESLKWVPRKRHNSRWPIVPKSEAGDPTSNQHRSAESERPVSAEPVEATAQVDEEQMSKRSTRRLSRRISLIPGDESPSKVSTVAPSPAGHATPAASPIKRSSAALSPIKVADSPLRSFRVNATPTKVILDSPKASPPERSPAKLQAPLTPDTRRSSPPASSSPSSPVPLLFDQPVPDAQPEPQHEVRRRLSLQSARRSERGSSGALRLLALKRGTDNLSRRHSLTSIFEGDGIRGDIKSRRKTMDVFSSGLEATGETADGRRATDATPDHHKDKEVVEIDMKTRLDIFGQPSAAAETSSPGRSNDGQNSSTGGGLNVEERVEAEAEAEHSTPRRQAVAASADSEATEALTFTPETPTCLAEGPGVGGASESDAVHLLRVDATPGTPHNVSSDDGDPALSDDIKAPSQNHTSEASPHADVETEQPSEQEIAETQFTDGGSPITDVEQLGSALDSSASSPDSLRPCTDTPNLAAEASQEIQDELPVADESIPDSDPPSGSIASAANESAVDPELPQHNAENIAMEDPAEQDMKALRDCGVECPGEVAGASSAEDSSGTPHSSPPSPGTPSGTPPASSTESFGGTATPQTNGDSPTAQRETTGFTPINKGRISPPTDLLAGFRDDEEPEAGSESDELDADEVIEEEASAEEDDEEVDAMDEDMTVEAPKPECDTLQLHARQDDSETEMLRNFVTKVAAGKSARAAAAAAALAKKIARRSSSLSSVASSTGSPVGRTGSETPDSRQPLGVRSPNSASPARKRKADTFEDDLPKKEDASSEPGAEPTEQPRLKKRRTYPESILKPVPAAAAPPSEAKTASPSNLATSPFSPKAAPRRSTRARSTRVALRPSAPSANSVALSMIPVRLPGMGAMDEPAEAARLSAARQRSEEKDLAAVTRANTRKNKGGAVPPPVVLARQAEDPAGWKMRELKGVWEAKERRREAAAAALSDKAPAGAGEEAEGKKVKEVRWAEELVTYQPYEQDEEGGAAFGGTARPLLADVMADDGVDEIAEAEPPVPAEPAVKTARVAARKPGSGSRSKTTTTTAAAATATAAASSRPLSSATSVPAPPAAPASARRTRSSKLPPPTPVKKVRSAGKPAAEAGAPADKAALAEKPAAAPSLRSRARSLPKRTAAPAAAGTGTPATGDPSPAAAPPSAARTGMATRRTRVTKVGMGGNGTPAPRRRGKAAA
ncbi:hypothetical protein VTH06DRAFT_2343 [Thermothelomyces fergusii]